MSPPMLLLVEIGLVLAGGYLFWLNRRQMASLRTTTKLTSVEGTSSNTVMQVDIVHDLADVLSEVRSAMEDMRTEWQRERGDLQHQLGEAEKTIAEIRAQMNQARSLTPQGFARGSLGTQPLPHFRLCSHSSGPASARLDRAIEQYADHLLHNGLSERTVKRITTALREFAIWFGGQCYGSVSPDAIKHSDIESFIQLLQRRQLSPGTITRKSAAVRRFIAWTSSQSLPPIIDTAVDAPRPLTMAQHPVRLMGETVSLADRRAAVFELAEQGLDTPLIAARLGLERETVRLILSAASGRRPANGFSDHLTFGLGESFSARTPQVVHSPLS